MMPKAAFIEEADDDDSDLELVVCGHKRGAGDNETQESVMGSNITGLPFRQGLSAAKSLKKP